MIRLICAAALLLGLMPAAQAQFLTGRPPQTLPPNVVPLTGSTFVPNMQLGWDLVINLSHSACPCTLAAPTNLAADQHGTIRINQSSGGGDQLALSGAVYGATWIPPLVQDSLAQNDWAYYTDANGKFQFIYGNLPPSLSNTAPNQLLGGDSMSTSNWAPAGLTYTVGGIADPAGGTSASTMIEDTSNGPHRVGQSTTLAIGTNTVSVFAKKVPSSLATRYIQIRVLDNFGNDGFDEVFDPVACTDVGPGLGPFPGIGTFHVTAHGTIARPNGFCEGWIQADLGTMPPLFTSIELNKPTFGDQYVGDGASGAYVFRAAARAGAVSPP